MQPEGEIGDLPGCPGGRVPGPGVALAQLRRHHLLDQIGVPVGGLLDRPQVPGLHSVLAQRGHRPGHGQRLRPVLPSDPADQAVGLELSQLLIADPRRFQQLAPGHVGWRPVWSLPADGGQPTKAAQAARPARSRIVIGRPVGEPFPDHLQRQVGVPLDGEDVAQPLDIRGREAAVARL